MDSLSQCIHRFFRQVVDVSDYAVLLETPCLVEPAGESSQTPEPVRWSMAGWKPRQILTLCDDSLTVIMHPEEDHQGVTESTTLTAPAHLWQTLEGFLEQAIPTSRVFCHIGYEALRWMDPAWTHITFQQAQHTIKPHYKTFPDIILCEMTEWVTWARENATTSIHQNNLHTVPITIHASSAPRRAALNECWKASIAEHDSNDTSLPFLRPNPASDSSQSPDTYPVSQSLGAFSDQAARILEAIQHGELYQANLSLAFLKETLIQPVALYQQLVQQNPSPFGGLFQTPLGTIVSNSPERLVDAKRQPDKGYTISCRPIAGTRGRKENPVDDDRLAHTLRNDHKEQAEHVMLVDLIRNDLGRIALAGSICVDELMVIERYRHVMHLVSHVSGDLPPPDTPWAYVIPLLKATFPGGTITGCPKIRCVEWLAKLESHRRGPYTGSMGYWDPSTGEMDFNILIRTALMQRHKHRDAYSLQFCVGAGLVADSVPEYEYKECLRKAQSMRLAIQTTEAQTQTTPL